jgi:nucleoside-diphosphate-sugar epimerase
MAGKAKVDWPGEQVCLVTGGTGFIGSHLVRELVGLGKKVVVFDFTPDTSYIADCLDKVAFVYGSVEDMAHVKRTVEEFGVTHVFHLAYLLVPDTDSRLATAIRVNCEGFYNVLEASRLQGVERVVWASTQSVYGQADFYPPGPVNEDVFVRPTTLYGACKLFNEHVAEHYWKAYGMHTIGLRKSVVYGLGKSRRRDLSIAHLLIENPLLGRPMEMPPVDYYANFVYVKDVVRAYLLAAQAPQPKHLIFNIGGQVLRASEVVERMKALVPGAEVHRREAYDLPHPIEVYNQDMTRAREELGYEPAYTLEDGVRDYQRMLEAYGDQYKSAWSEFVARPLV